MEKYYKVSESDLREMLEAQATLMALENTGVDNWWGYGEGFNEFIEEALKDADYQVDEDDDLSMDLVAKAWLQDYEEIK